MIPFLFVGMVNHWDTLVILVGSECPLSSGKHVRIFPGCARLCSSAEVAAVKSKRGFRKYLTNTAWLFFGEMTRLLIGLFVSVTVARYLGPENFGRYNYVIALLAILDVVTRLGMTTLATREMVAHPEERDDILGVLFFTTAATSLVAYLALLVIVAWTVDEPAMAQLFAVMGGTLLLTPWSGTQVWFQSQVRGDLAVTSRTVAIGIFAALKYAAVKLQMSLLAFGVLFLLESLALQLALQVNYALHFGRMIDWRFRWAKARDYLRQSWPLMFSGLAIMIYMRIDVVMLEALVDDVAVGEYSVAVRLSTVTHALPLILASSLFPAIMKASKGDPRVYQRRLAQYIELNVGLAYLITAAIVATAPWLVIFLFGESYKGSISILQVHAWSIIFVFIGVARSQYVTAEGYFRFSMVATVTGGIVNIALNALLIPIHHGLGAAIATLVSTAITAVVAPLVWPPTQGLGIMILRSLYLETTLHSAWRQCGFARASE